MPVLRTLCSWQTFHAYNGSLLQSRKQTLVYIMAVPAGYLLMHHRLGDRQQTQCIHHGPHSKPDLWCHFPSKSHVRDIRASVLWKPRMRALWGKCGQRPCRAVTSSPGPESSLSLLGVIKGLIYMWLLLSACGLSISFQLETHVCMHTNIDSIYVDMSTHTHMHLKTCAPLHKQEAHGRQQCASPEAEWQR